MGVHAGGTSAAIARVGVAHSKSAGTAHPSSRCEKLETLDRNILNLLLDGPSEGQLRIRLSMTTGYSS
jgi:hypothetical protein